MTLTVNVEMLQDHWMQDMTAAAAYRWPPLFDLLRVTGGKPSLMYRQ
jgi:hypothetical protein